jgi:hypothetical protein
MSLNESVVSESAANVIGAISGFLNEPGDPLMGLDMTEGEAIALVKQHFPDKPYCVVANWMLVELDVDEVSLKAIKRLGSRPYLIYSHNVLQDSAGRFYRGEWVRSTLQVSFTQGGLFETVNTVYVLLGQGCRKKSVPEVVMSIHG